MVAWPFGARIRLPHSVLRQPAQKRPNVVLLLAVALVLVACPPSRVCAEAERGNSAVRTGPTPEWVETLEWNLPVQEPTGTAAQIILSDQQTMLAPNGGDYYFRQVVKLLTQEAVSTFAQQTNVLSPEFGDVVWHTLIVHRDGKSDDRLSSTEFRKLQREPGLEAQILTGEITYAAVLSDIRVGDILETAYTRHHVNPLLGGHTSARHYLGASNPTLRERVVVHVPNSLGRALAGFLLPDGTTGLPEALYRDARLRLALQETSTTEAKSFSWEGLNLPAVEFDQSVPGRAYPYWPMFHVSTFMSWADVVQWATPLFEPTALPQPVAKLVESWKNDAEPQRLEKAVRWVEDEVRYFALDLGQHTLKPRPLADVCSTRFGDCKDKAVLLVSILRELGFEAWPALANTYWRDRLYEVRPSPGAFNHAIVAYKYLGKLRWIDPTMTRQGGAPGNWVIPPYRAALVIRPDANHLTKIEESATHAPDTLVLDHISIDPTTEDALMTTEVRLTGLIADQYRPSLSSLAPSERSKGWFNYIALFYRGLEETKPPVVEDDAANNTIVIRAEYKIPNFVGRDASRTFVGVYGYPLRTLIGPEVSRRRRWPLALPSDRHVRHRIEVDLPFDVDTGEFPEAILAEGLEYRIERGTSGRRLVVQHDLRVVQDAVPADRMNQFCDNLQEILGCLSTLVFKANQPEAPKLQASSAASTPDTHGTRRTPSAEVPRTRAD